MLDDDVDQDLILLELKYCERCGGLWLRNHGSDEVYCPTCSETMLHDTWWSETETALRLAWKMQKSADQDSGVLVTTGGNA